MPREYPRASRVGAQLQRELTELIRDEVRDPRAVGTTVTRVDVSPDLRNARVYVSLLDPSADLEGAAKALNGAAGVLQRGLGRRLRLRYLPHLHFHADHSGAQADRLTRLIHDAVTADAGHRKEKDA